MKPDFSERIYYVEAGTKDSGDFRVGDFQSSPGGLSVIDPELFREVYDKAVKPNRNERMCLFITYPFFFSLCQSLAFVDFDRHPRFWQFPICCWLLTIFMFFCIQDCEGSKRGALIDPYKSFFLETYGIELGYEKWQTGVDSETQEPTYSYGMYLRRQQISTDEEALREPNDHTDIADRDFAPIFLKEFIPGDITIAMKHDVTSMTIDAKTWNIRQSTLERTRDVQTWVGVNTVMNISLWYFFVL